MTKEFGKTRESYDRGPSSHATTILQHCSQNHHKLSYLGVMGYMLTPHRPYNHQVINSLSLNLAIWTKVNEDLVLEGRALSAGPFHSLGEGFYGQLPFCFPRVSYCPDIFKIKIYTSVVLFVNILYILFTYFL